MSPFEQALILGVVQGLTEFLPISGDGHLALAQLLLDVDNGGLTLSVLLHAGTLLATVLYFRQRLAKVLLDLGKHLGRGRLPAPSSAGWDAVLVLLAALPTGLIGLALHDTVVGWTRQPLATGFGFVVTACLLTSTLWTKPGALSSPSLPGALLLGLAQGLAVAPGVSRSGITIVAALWLGLRAERAFELSMLMSVPAVSAAIALELVAGDSMAGHALAIGAGVLTSFAVGYVGLRLLRRVVLAGSIAWFSLWVLPLALATLALAKAWPS
ncbi:MAG TPA: undecaprenyl-diphosphate phosphatase [Polyangiaceae bacterium]|jgi:undecaprenyl-diphosphatase|nr:undecaprenyl-diphosphate phosphatase [Polyangiaceae bacterium]